MTSGITTTPIIPGAGGRPPSVEYTLKLADRLALDMFLFDTVIRKGLRFRIKFYASYLLIGVLLAAVIGGLVWGGLTLWNPFVEPLTPALAGITGALTVFTTVVIGLIIPNAGLHAMDRCGHEKRIRQVRAAQFRAGILRFPQHLRVVLTTEGFSETAEACETGGAVEVREQRETIVGWTAVGSIEVATDHAFVAVKDKGYLILPRTAFATEEDFRNFVDRMRDYREAAGRARAPSEGSPRLPDTRITR